MPDPIVKVLSVISFCFSIVTEYATRWLGKLLSMRSSSSFGERPLSTYVKHLGSTERGISDVALVTIIVAGLLVRLFGVDSTGIWIDESVSASQAGAGSFWSVFAATANDNFSPLHNIILFPMIKLFGDSETVLRLPSVILGTATIYLIYRLGRELFDRLTGLIAAQFMSISVFHIWYSIEASMYALLCFMAVAYVLTAFRALRRRTPALYAVCTAAGVLLMYSHVFGTFVFLGVNSAVLLYAAAHRVGIPRGLVEWLLSQLVAGLLFVPGAIILIMRAQTSVDSVASIPPLSIEYLSLTVSNLVGGPYMVWSMVLLLVFALVVSRIFPAAGEPSDELPYSDRSFQFPLLLLLCWIVVPLVLALSISLVSTPMIYDRDLIAVLPAFFLIISYFINDVFRSPLLKIAAVLLCIIPSFMMFAQAPEPPWRRSLAGDFKSLDLGWSRPELVSSMAAAGHERASAPAS